MATTYRPNKPKLLAPTIACPKAGQKSFRRRDARRPGGTASTMTHNPTIAKPMNSNTNASTAIPPEIKRYNCRVRVERLLIYGAAGERLSADGAWGLKKRG